MKNDNKKEEKPAEDMGVLTETPVYFERIPGYLAKPIISGSYPGVVMIHEWWGLNDEIRKAARDLAKEGYIVLAVDLYEGQVTNDPDRATKLAGSISQRRAVDNLRSAVFYLRDKERTAKVASLGWCFGGNESLDLALSGEPMDATVIYYGKLVADKDTLSRIYWPVLGIFGDRDTVVPLDEINAFKKALDELGIENEIHIYPNLGHAFANPSNPNYAPEETKDAREKTLKFLERHLKS